jgi:hypothetical protein
MARRRGTSRVTRTGTNPERVTPSGETELPSIRHRRPALFWTVVIGVFAMVLPIVLTFVQAIS